MLEALQTDFPAFDNVWDYVALGIIAVLCLFIVILSACLSGTKEKVRVYSAKVTEKELACQNLRLDSMAIQNELVAEKAINKRMLAEETMKDNEVSELQHIAENKDAEIDELHTKIAELEFELKAKAAEIKELTAKPKKVAAIKKEKKTTKK